MKNGPLVSIGVPVYNAASTISRALDSLVRQDYKNLEILVSDNCSDDGSHEICLEYAAKDPRIQVSRNAQNIGAGGNFRLVCGKASGKYFCWAASDDYYHPEFVSSLVRDMENRPDAVVSMSSVVRVSPQGERISVTDFREWKNPLHLSSRELVRRIISFEHAIKHLHYNFFILGLFRLEDIRALNARHSFTRNLERPFLAVLAMRHKFSYVDRELMEKTWNDRSFKARNPDDPIARVDRKAGLWGRYWRTFGLMLGDPRMLSPGRCAVMASLATEMFSKVAWRRTRTRAGDALRAVGLKS